MIRTIDTQMMNMQSLNAARVAGEKVQGEEQHKDWKAELQKEIIAAEDQQVAHAEALEGRRIQEDENRKNKEGDFFSDEEVYPDLKETLEEEQAEQERLNVWNMGAEIDISV